MGGYIGSSVGNVANAAERKQTYSITTATTSLTGLAYTPTKVHVFHNGVRLVDGTDYTATNGTSITLTNAAQNGDEVVVISYPSFQTSDTVSAANGGTFAGNVAFSGTTTGLDVNGTDLILDADGDSKIEASTDDTITVHTAGSERMRLDSSGNVGIGTAAPTTFSGFKTLHFKNGSGDAISLVESDGGVISQEIASDSTGVTLGSRSNHNLRITTNDTERMRIASDGALLLSTTSNPSGGKLAIDYARGSSAGMRIKDTVGSGGTGVIADFYNSSNNSMGAITHDSSNITYGGTSDYRLKENINYTWDGITKVKELKPARFTWIDNPDVGIIDGFLAHEVSSVVPKAVVGQKDASETYTDEDGNEQTKIIPQQLDQSKLVPLLTKALQEAITKIETLETKVAALEAE
jgi:hypothetical protein